MYKVDDTTFHATKFDRNNDGTPRIIVPQGILLHSGGGSRASDMYELEGNDPKHPVGVGQYCTRDGLIYQLGPENRAYWHAGAPDHNTRSWWGWSPGAFGIYNGNLFLGMETEHREGQDWPRAQLDAIQWWGREKVKQYGIKLSHVGAHRWYAPSRKKDPEDLTDDVLTNLFRSFYTTEGYKVRILGERGANIRQAPSTNSPVVLTLPEGYIFWADEIKKGQKIDGTDVWYHFAGPTADVPDPRGFVFGGICQVVTE
jgi:hypothetical protein